MHSFAFSQYIYFKIFDALGPFINYYNLNLLTKVF